MQVVFNYILNNYEQIFIVGAIMVSAIIVLIGLMKPVFFNKIKNKSVRKVLLAFTSVAMSFGSTAIYYLIEKYSFEYYWVSACATAVSSIVVYWFYENTCLRNLIEKIGTLALRKFAFVGLKLFTDEEKNNIAENIKSATNDLVATTTAEIKAVAKKAIIDNDLEKL